MQGRFVLLPDVVVPDSAMLRPRSDVRRGRDERPKRLGGVQTAGPGAAGCRTRALCRTDLVRSRSRMKMPCNAGFG